MKLVIAIACLGYATAQNIDQNIYNKDVEVQIQEIPQDFLIIDPVPIFPPEPLGKHQLQIMPKPQPGQEKETHQILEPRGRQDFKDKKAQHKKEGHKQGHKQGRPQHMKENHKNGKKPEHQGKHNLRQDPFTDWASVDQYNMPMPPPGMNEPWEMDPEHMMKNKHKRGREQHERKGRKCWVFALTAIIFTIFGLLLGKCIRRCKKNNRKCKNMKDLRNPVPISRTSEFIEEQIKEQEQKLLRLKEQLESKRNEEARLAEENRKNSEARRLYEQRAYGNYRNPQVQNRNYYGYYQPQNGYYNQVPVGRPLNESANSSFAQEYPQL